MPADQLDDQIRSRARISSKSPTRARQHAADHRRAAVEALDLLGALGEQRREGRADGAVAEQADFEGAAVDIGSGSGGPVGALAVDIARDQILEASRA